MSFAVPAQSAVSFTFAQVGNDVVLTGTGSLNLAGAQIACCGGQDGYLNSGSAGLAVGGPFGNVSFIYLTGRDARFGTGGYINGTPDAGDRIGMNAYDGGGYVNVYQGYISGTALSGSTRFANQTLDTLGLIGGRYTYTLPSDTVTVFVPGGVPEPATWAMLIMGFGVVGGALRRRARMAFRFA